MRSKNPLAIGEFILLSSQGVHFRTLASNGLSFNEESKPSSHLLGYGNVTSLGELSPSHVVFLAPTSETPLIHFNLEDKTILRKLQWPGSLPVDLTATPEGRLVIKDSRSVWLQDSEDSFTMLRDIQYDLPADRHVSHSLHAFRPPGKPLHVFTLEHYSAAKQCKVHQLHFNV